MTMTIRSRGPDALQDRFAERVEFVRRQIGRSVTGTRLMERLSASRHRVRIVPFGRSDVRQRVASGRGPDGAYTMPGYWSNGGTVDAGVTGPGTGAEIHFSPGWVVQHNAYGRDDIVLVHEMAHALRAVTGTSRFRVDAQGELQAARIDGVGSIDEFFVHTLESMHASEVGWQVRLDNHEVGRPTPAYLHNPPYPDIFAGFHSRMPDGMGDFAAAPGPFNPFRDVLGLP